jgi:hypothetical protein
LSAGGTVLSERQVDGKEVLHMATGNGGNTEEATVDRRYYAESPSGRVCRLGSRIEPAVWRWEIRLRADQPGRERRAFRFHISEAELQACVEQWEDKSHWDHGPPPRDPENRDRAFWLVWNDDKTVLSIVRKSCFRMEIPRWLGLELIALFEEAAENPPAALVAEAT